MVITFKGLGNSLRGKTLWQIVCLTLLWMVWQERNNRIFEDKGRTEEMLWDLLLFHSSLRPLVVQLLEEFLKVFYNSTGLRFALQKFESVGVFLCF